MYQIKTLNNISEKGLKLLPSEQFQISGDFEDPTGIILRSFKMSASDLSPSLLGIARAGAGVNNIPVEDCSQKGIVVFNTPGANANAVKELVICGLLMSSRKVSEGVRRVLDYKEDPNISKTVEKIKKEFAGPEIQGKTLGIIGMGAIGANVARAALGLNMKIKGYDPYLSVDHAWNVPYEVEKVSSLEKLLSESDYISIHMPLNEKTKNFINSGLISNMKPGVRILNFSRAGIVSSKDILEAIEAEKVGYYVCDFPTPELVNRKNVLLLPHLGASTPEAEENCAIMAAGQLKEFLLTGNIINSVNFPNVVMERTGSERFTIINSNIPNMVGQISAVLAKNNVNIHDMINKSMGNYAYNIFETDQDISSWVSEIENIEGVIKVRRI